MKIGGTAKDVLIQAFERRVLTYTPSNRDPFRWRWATWGSITTTGVTRVAAPSFPLAKLTTDYKYFRR